MTNCTQGAFGFPPVKRRRVEAEFSGGQVTSDGGVVLLRQADRRTGLMEAIDEVIPDPRDPELITHSQLSLLRQRVYGLALGYEDLNDHGTLRTDPAIQSAVDRDTDLGSQATLCRLEQRSNRAAGVAMHRVLVEQGVSAPTVQRIWDAYGLQPHRVKAFKLSRDRRFVEKLTDVVGLYLNPPDKAVVLCVDEKSQIQALDRTQPGLPLKRGRCGTLTHDYKRHGTTTLFAALIGECYQRHRHQEFLKFLRRLNREFPKAKTLHLVVDNYGTHKHPNVQKWLASHPRFHLHFTPTSSSWLNLVERWFREITEKRIRRGVFRSVPELKQAIAEFLEVHNRDPKPFVWTARVDDIGQGLKV